LKRKLRQTHFALYEELKFSSLPTEILETSKDSVLKKKRDRWHESLAKDIYVEEALNVLDDLQTKVILKETKSSQK
jgi:carboxyl-terminal processing protease